MVIVDDSHVIELDVKGKKWFESPVYFHTPESSKQ